jgi:predicted ATP-dependent endonuclease of OLD family
MKLLWFQVQEFQSVKNSGIINADDIVCLVGKNEAGKSALLRALYRLHPIVDTDSTFSVTHDYPRIDVEDYRLAIEEKKRVSAIPIQAGYELDQEELAEIQNLFGEDCLKSSKLTVSKNYDNEVVCSLTTDDSKALAYLIEHADFSEQIDEAILDAHRSVDPLIAALEVQEEVAAEYSYEVEEEATEEAGYEVQEEAKKEYSYREYTPDSLIAVLDVQARNAEVNRVKAILETIKSQSLSTYIWHTLLKAHWPKFLYFDEYYQMTGHENIQALMQREARNQLRPSDHPMLGLVRLARLQLKELLNPNSSIELRNRLEGASNHLTKQALKYWSQNKHLKMSFDVRQGVAGDPEEMRSGINIWGGVLDTSTLRL